MDLPAATVVRTEGDSAPPYSVHASPGFASWLHSTGGALAITTYQIGKIFLIGADTPNTLCVSERTFERCLGVVAVGRSTLIVAGLNAIWRFGNIVPPGKEMEGYDAVYVPRVSWFTGDVQAHDVAVAPSGRPIFVNTLFSCLATVDEATSFRRVWQPSFVTDLMPQDRCHLNGLATDPDGMPHFMTAAAETNERAGWRAGRVGSGIVLDVRSGMAVCRGLTMPHSPRLHEGRLYVLNAGTGELGLVDVGAGRFRPLSFVPGFARGLAFVGGHALVGASLPRANAAFSGLPIEERLSASGLEPRCELSVIDLDSGRIEHTLRLGGVVREFYDMAFLAGVRKPMLVGMQSSGPLSQLVSRGADLPLAALAAPRQHG